MIGRRKGTQPDSAVKKRCGTCQYYHASPLKGQGWCRNPKLRGEHERALVGAEEYRCRKMFLDSWEPAEGTHTAADSVVIQTPVIARPKPKAGKSITPSNFENKRNSGLFLAIFVMLVIGAGGVLFFSDFAAAKKTAAPDSNPTVVAQPGYTGSARNDFWLKADANRSADSIQYVIGGTQLRLIDSKAGELIDSSSSSPAKWFWVEVVGTGQKGWAYSGWVFREQ